MSLLVNETGSGVVAYNYLKVFLGHVGNSGTAPPGGLAMLDDEIRSTDADDRKTSSRTKPYVSFDDFRALFEDARFNAPYVRIRGECVRMFVQFYYIFYKNWKDFTEPRVREALLTLIEILTGMEMGVVKGSTTLLEAFKASMRPVRPARSEHKITNLLRLFITFQNHASDVVEILGVQEYNDMFRGAVVHDLVGLGVNVDDFMEFVLAFSRNNSIVEVATHFGGRVRHDIMKANIRREIHRLKQNPTPQQRLKVIQMIHHQSHFDKHGLTISM